LSSFLVAPRASPPPPPPRRLRARGEGDPAAVRCRAVDGAQSGAKEVAMIKEEELPPPSSACGGGVPGGVRAARLGVIAGLSVEFRRRAAAASSSRAPKPVTRAHTSRRQRATGKTDSPNRSDLSAAGEAGAHFGRGQIERDHRQRWYYSESNGGQRASFAVPAAMEAVNSGSINDFA